jgi:hypothetical protein
MPDFIQASPSAASTGESRPKSLHPRLAAPLLTLYSSSRRRARWSHTLFLRAPPPPRTATAPASFAIFMPRHRHGEPPAPSCCLPSGLYPGGAHPAHRAAPHPMVSRLPGRLGRWTVGHQPSQGRLNRLLAQRSYRPRAGFRPSTVPGVLNIFPFVLINRK